MSNEFRTSAHPAELLRPSRDKRDRTTPSYGEWLACLTIDVKVRSILHPIYCIPTGEKIEVVAGETRRRAALCAGLDSVPIVILDRPLTPAELLREELLEKEMRRELTDLERAARYEQLMNMQGWLQYELARFVNVSPARITKVLAISKKLPEDIRALVGDGKGKIPPASAYHLSRVPNVDAMREIAKQICNGELTRDMTQVEVAKRLGNWKAKEKPVKAKTN